MTTGTREQRSEYKKRGLLDAAERVYFAEGDLGLTVRRLAAAASTTSQTIYTYFGSRDSVIDSMYARALNEIDMVLASFERVAGPAHSAEGANTSLVAEMMLGYRRHTLANPAQFWMLATGISPEGTDRAEIAARRDRIVQLIGACQSNGSSQTNEGWTPGSPHVLLAAVNGYVWAEIHELIELSAYPDRAFSDFVVGLLDQRPEAIDAR